MQVQDSLGPLTVLISPLLEIEFLDPPKQDTKATLVFTSRNGVEAWAQAGNTAVQECFCVGDATASAAREIGFDPHISGGTVEYLLDDLIRAAPTGQILHIHGRHTRGDLVGKLNDAGLSARGFIAYEQNLLNLNTEALALLQGGAPMIVPLFSPRSAAQFDAAGPFGPQVDVIAISKAAALLCRGARIAPLPSANGMLSAISAGLIA